LEIEQQSKKAMKKLLKSFALIINYKTFIITALSVLSTYTCFHLGLTAKFPDMLVGVAIVFPVVFSIGSAYTRRETALQRYADFKGHVIAVYFATRDWPTSPDQNITTRMSELIQEMAAHLKVMLKLSPKEWNDQEKKMYTIFSKLSKMTMELRVLGVQSGEISRVSQYLSKIIIAFDNMKIIHNYRTPITLRTYSKVFIYVFPIIYGPYFASTFHDFSAQLEYVMPILYSFILVSLDNIQDHLENPFDEVGEDDIAINAEEIRQLIS
jgi:predicted membrane chloride channel (bestrophin family)